MKIFINFLLLLFGISSCKKYLEVDPPSNQLTAQTVFESDANATAALFGIYSSLERQSLLYHLTLYTALSADEGTVQTTSPQILDFATNSLTSNNTNVGSLWTRFYNVIYQCNALLDRLNNSKNVTSIIRKQLEGEALFLRAFSYFYLVNLFGNVPLILSSNYTSNSTVKASSIDTVYLQIKHDLLTSRGSLGEFYLDGLNKPGIEKVRVNRYAVNALLARVYLFQHDYSLAEKEAQSLIDEGKYELVNNPDQVFLKNSKEAIWQIQALEPRYSTDNGNFFILTTRPTVSSLSDDLYDAMDSLDIRKRSWIKSIISNGQTFYYPYKYKISGTVSTPTEYTMILRLAEVYLILAEAKVRLGKFEEGAAALNIIKNRAGLPPVDAVLGDALLQEIYKERQFEFLYELGMRWLDLKQSGTANDVMAPLKGMNWTNDDMLYPIPQDEIIRNSLLTQNPGY